MNIKEVFKRPFVVTNSTKELTDKLIRTGTNLDDSDHEEYINALVNERGLL